MKTTSVKVYKTESAEADLKQFNIERRKATSKDIVIDILFCGVCHSDLHFACNDWGMT